MLQSLLRTTDAKDLDCPLSTITTTTTTKPPNKLCRYLLPFTSGVSASLPPPPSEKQNHFFLRSGIGGKFLCIVEP